MTCKLDQVTNREWEEHRNSLSEPPTLAVFIEFIRNRADLLETLEESKSLFTKGEGVHVNNIKQYKHSSGSSETSRNPLSCPMCQKDHFIFQCDKFKSLPVQSRISKAQTSNVCLNCLRPGHNIYKCKMGHCKYCREKHNTLLHFDRDIVVPNQTTSTLASVNHLSTSRVVLLSTALVNVSDAEGNAHTARILLDNGSTTNLISQELARKLNISTYTVESKESSSTTKLRVVFDASATTSSGKSFNQIQMDGSLRCFLVETALHESPTSAHVRVSFGERLTQFARYPSPLLLKTLQRGEYVESSHSPQPRPRQVGATVTSWCNGSPRIAGSRGQDLLMRTGRAHAFLLKPSFIFA
nr:uncharacterized protein LOC126054057 isoform X1 [Helicoverpa armigera]